MVEKLGELLPGFPGLEAHIRCFAHTINLTAKGVLRPFEPVKVKDAVAEGDELEAIAKDAEVEELRAELKDLEENGEQSADDLQGFVNVLDEMSEEERQEWQESVRPVRGALIKVCLIHKMGRHQSLMGTNQQIISHSGSYDNWLPPLNYCL